MPSRKPAPGKSLLDLYPEICLEWNYTRNAGKPEDYSAYSSQRVMWTCQKAQHEWPTSICERTRQGKGCPACYGRTVTDRNRLSLLFPHLVKEWSPKNKNRPKNYAVQSHKKMIWNCSTCRHEWTATIGDRTRGRGCPACSGRILTDNNRLSLLCPDLVKEWSPKNEKSPSDYAVQSNKKMLWVCFECEHEWPTAISHRSLAKTGCPACADYGFNQKKPAAFYVKKIFKKDGIIGCAKIGVTRDLNTRMRKQITSNKELSHELIAHFEFAKGSDALTLENMFKMLFKDKLGEAGRLGIQFDGSTETLPLAFLDEIIEMAEQYKIEVQARDLINELMPSAS